MLLSRIGLLGRPPKPPVNQPLGFYQPVTSDLAPYAGTTTVGSYTKYTSVPWGACFGVSSWNESTTGNTLTHPVMDIYVPPGTAPANGWPVIVRAHANGSNHLIPDGTGSLWDQLIVPAMTEGFCVVSVEFRHPVPNESLGAPHFDIGYCLQFIRGLHAALNLDRTRFHGFAQSRGNLLLWQTVSTNLKNTGDANYAKRQDSTIKSLWGINTQSTYSSTQFINTFVNVGDRAAALADPNYVDNPAFGSAYNLIVGGSQELPYLCVTHDNPYVLALPNYGIGTYSKAAIDANGNLRVHCPEFGKHLWEAYSSRGALSRITIADSVSGGVPTMADSVPWFKALDENPGITAKEARSMVLLRRFGGSAHYVTSPPSGTYASGTNLTLVNTVGSTVGILADGVYGYANRANTVDPLGATLKQTSASLRPTLSNAGSGYGLSFDATDDAAPIFLANNSVDVYTWTMTGEVTGYTSRTSTKFELGTSKIGGRNVALIAAVPNSTLDATSLKFLRQFAFELTNIPF